MSETLANPQLVPSGCCITILQDHGLHDGGWGPAALVLPWQTDRDARPLVYTGNAPHVLATLAEVCEELARVTGKPTRLVRFTVREDLAVFEGRPE